jgi:2-polyprenyl-3-methyl-5-hydroxy-6-metoxy-1,4-benzoquinol methylase
MNKDDALAWSWDRNAGNWTRVVRERLVPSRRAGTDQAVLNAVVELAPKRLLDIGCGEGWLVRAAVARAGCAAVGIDGAAALIDAARAADPISLYRVVDYDSFAASDIGVYFDVAVFNYSLFAEDLAPLLRAAAARLAPGGAIVIQTPHPGDGTEDGWRTEDFTAFDGGDWAAMPWYYRTSGSWRATVRDAGLEIRDIREPAAEDGRVLSLLLICAPKPTKSKD